MTARLLCGDALRRVRDDAPLFALPPAPREVGR
jgi:hypothetical protein